MESIASRGTFVRPGDNAPAASTATARNRDSLCLADTVILQVHLFHDEGFGGSGHHVMDERWVTT